MMEVDPPPMRLDSQSDMTASPESNKLPPIHFIKDDLSDQDISARLSASDSSDIEAADHWQEARMCQWGDGSCNHRFILSRASGQNPLVTVIRKHLQERHPDILTRENTYVGGMDAPIRSRRSPVLQDT